VAFIKQRGSLFQNGLSFILYFMMNRFFTLALLIFLLPQLLRAQTLKGQLKLDPSVRPMVYLIEVSDYNYGFGGYLDAVSDSIPVGPTGYLSSGILKKQTLYRLNVVGEGVEAGALVQDGMNDNYAFLATSADSGTIYITGDMTRFFRTFHAVSSHSADNDLQREIAAMRDSKLPVMDTMAGLARGMMQLSPSDTVGLRAFQMDALMKIREVNSRSNEAISKQMDHIDNPLLLSLGLIMNGLGFMDVSDEVFKREALLRPYKEMPLVRSVLGTIVRDVDLSFLSQRQTLLDGSHLVLSDLKARYILLDFWASWCLPCRQAIRTSLKELKGKYDSRQLQVVGVNRDEDKKKALAAVKEDGNPYPQLWEGAVAPVSALFKVQNFPTYILIDRDAKEWHFLDHPVEVARYIDGSLQ